MKTNPEPFAEGAAWAGAVGPVPGRAVGGAPGAGVEGGDGAGGTAVGAEGVGADDGMVGVAAGVAGKAGGDGRVGPGTEAGGDAGDGDGAGVRTLGEILRVGVAGSVCLSLLGGNCGDPGGPDSSGAADPAGGVLEISGCVWALSEAVIPEKVRIAGIVNRIRKPIHRKLFFLI